jgi:sec-independent protein translocase protein TatC
MSESVSSEENSSKEQGFLSHLVELRDRLLRMVLAVGVCFIVLFPFSDQIYSLLASPLLKHLPEGSNMIAIDVASPFLIPFKLVLMLSVFLSVPFLLYQIWAFVAPGLYKHEQRLARPLLVSSTILFYLGVLFAYVVVFPLIFGFFTSIAPEGVEVSTDIGRYLDFVITIFFAFGIAFEVPIATILLVITGVTTPDALVEKRPYFIVAAFVLGMFLTPPDIISQTLLALPMWLLFELGIFFSRSFLKRKEEAGDARDMSDTAVAGVSGVATAKKSSDESETASTADEHEIIEDQEYQSLTDQELDSELDDIESEEEDADK